MLFANSFRSIGQLGWSLHQIRLRTGRGNPEAGSGAGIPLKFVLRPFKRRVGDRSSIEYAVKDDRADLGIIKVDLLGLGMMAVLEGTIDLIEEHHGENVDLAHLPQDQPDVYNVIRKADTVGMFSNREPRR